MSGQLTTNTTPFIEAQQYSKFIVANLPELLLPAGMWRDVSDFPAGSTLNIKTVGSAAIQDVSEDIPLTFQNIDTGTVTLTISEYVGDAWRISDELREDGAQIEQLAAMRAMEATRLIAEYHETKFLAACNAAQTNANANTVNGKAHRIASAETGDVASIDHFIAMKLAFDKARVPQMGRIAIVDPSVEATLNSLSNIVNASNNPMFEGIVTEGFAKSHKFIRNIFGWDIWVSNLLPTVTNGGDGTETITSSVANVFMSVLDDQTKPVMHAWRRQPKVEGWRDEENRCDKFQATTRFGFGAQRVDTLGILLTDPANF